MSKQSKRHMGANIKSAEGVDAITISNEGYVQLPSRPAFFAQLTAGQPITQVGVDELVNFTAVTNVGGHFANNRFTAPVTGLYQFNVSITAAIDQSSEVTRSLRLRLFKNGTTGFPLAASLQHISYEQVGGNYSNCATACIVQLQAGDYVEVYAATSGVANQTNLYASSLENACHFSGYLL